MNLSQHPFLPERLPVMLLPSCNVFPHALLPLHIFESRYREMLADVLESERMFCIGTLVAPENPVTPEKCVHPASTACFIRACIHQADGCFNLLLQGVQRIQLGDFRCDRPYVTAAVEPILTEPYDGDRLREVTEEVRACALELVDAGDAVSVAVHHFLLDLQDPEMLADLVAYHLIRDPAERQPLLGMACLTTRLENLKRALADRLHGGTDAT